MDAAVVTRHQRLIDNISNPNIAEDLAESGTSDLNVIGQRVLREYNIDVSSRSEWLDRCREAMDLAMQVAKEKTFPWPGASNVIYPLMTQAAVEFQARAYPAIVQGRDVVKGIAGGKDDGIVQRDPQTGQPIMQQGQDGQPVPVYLIPPGARQERATRIGQHMSWQLLEEMTEWEDETDKLLLILPIVGCVFRKSFQDTGLGQPASMMVLAQNLVINYGAKSMERAPRITEIVWLYPHEIEERVRQGLFLDHDYGMAQDGAGDEDAPHEFLEQHRWLDLDEDGYPEPYIVTVHKQTGKVARIVARYDADGVKVRGDGEVVKIEPVHYYTKYDFLPNPDGGIYGVGFGQLLGPINRSINTALNQLFDAGNLQNTGGGFVGRGLSMHSGAIRFKLGEWKIVNAPGQSIRDAIVPFSHTGPSAQLMTLLTFLVDAGKDVASIKDVLQGQGDQLAASMQPTTLLAMIQQGLQTFTAVFKRVARALKCELDKLYRLNRIYLPDRASFQAGEEWQEISREDYAKGSGVRPVADPSMVSDMQRMAKAQVLQSYQNDPLCDGVEIRKYVLSATQIEGVDRIVHGQAPPNPAILQATAQLELQHREADVKAASAKASQIRDLSAAILNIANAEKAEAAIVQADAEVKLAHSAQWLKLLEMQLDGLLAPPQGPQGPGPQGGMPGGSPGGLAALPPPMPPGPPAGMPMAA